MVMKRGIVLVTILLAVLFTALMGVAPASAEDWFVSTNDWGLGYTNIRDDFDALRSSWARTSYTLGLSFRVSDTENGTFTVGAKYSVNEQRISEVCANYMVKMGPSSEDRKIKAALQRIRELEEENAILREEGIKKDERISSLEERVSALERAWLEGN
jgi:hypothetical protein